MSTKSQLITLPDLACLPFSLIFSILFFTFFIVIYIYNDISNVSNSNNINDINSIRKKEDCEYQMESGRLINSLLGHLCINKIHRIKLQWTVNLSGIRGLKLREGLSSWSDTHISMTCRLCMGRRCMPSLLQANPSQAGLQGMVSRNVGKRVEDMVTWGVSLPWNFLFYIIQYCHMWIISCCIFFPQC